MSRLTTYVSVTALSMSLLGLATPAGAQALPERIKLGQLVSKTGPGAAASIAWEIGNNIAVAEINRSGGILGHPIDVAVGDDQTDPTMAVTEARRLVQNEKVNIMVGPILSLLGTAVIPVTTAGKVLEITSSGSTSAGGNAAPYFFSMNFNVEAAGVVMADYTVNTLKVKSIGWLGDNGPQGKQVLAAVTNTLASKGLHFSGVQEFQQGSMDVTPQLLALRRDKPDVLYLWSINGQDTGNVVNALDNIGWKVPVLASHVGTLLPAQILKVAGPKAFDNMVAIGVKAFTACPGDKAGNPAFARLKDSIKAMEPNRYTQIPPITAAWGYDAVYIMKAAIEANRTLDAAVLSHWIEQNVQNVKGLVSGQLSTTPTGHFLLGVESMTLVAHPDQLGQDGLMTRMGC